jgi:hypothetical protein
MGVETSLTGHMVFFFNAALYQPESITGCWA